MTMLMNILKLKVSFTLLEKDPFYRFYVQCPEVKDRPATGDTSMPADHLIEQGYQLMQLFRPDPLRNPDEVYAIFQRVGSSQVGEEPEKKEEEL